MWVIVVFIVIFSGFIVAMVVENAISSKVNNKINVRIEEQVKTGGPPGGLWVNMLKPYHPESTEWDGHTWCYQHPQTGEWYEFASFKTKAEGIEDGFIEAAKRHESLSRFNKMYSGVYYPD